MAAAIEVSGLTKRFGSRTAVDSLELSVPEGCAYGFLGPNGAGKTTLIRMLLGLTARTRARCSMLGLQLPAERAPALARTGAIVEEPRFHGHLTGRENLRISRRPGQRGVRRGSPRRWPRSASATAPTSASSATPWACASGWGSPAACSPTPAC